MRGRSPSSSPANAAKISSNPNLRLQERATEYSRALNAAKLEKIFVRPFIGAMDGHVDSVSSMAKNPNHLKGIFLGSMDGGVKFTRNGSDGVKTKAERFVGERANQGLLKDSYSAAESFSPPPTQTPTAFLLRRRLLASTHSDPDGVPRWNLKGQRCS